MFRERRLLWLPVLVLLVGFGLTYALVNQLIPEALTDAAFFFVYFLFIPQALFTFFVGGFLAPRAGYLVGFVLGLLNGGLWAVLALGFGIGYIPDSGQIGILPVEERADFSTGYIVIAVIYGTLAAAFAAWYRGFLRQMQERGRQRRAEREAQDRAKRRDERRAARKGT